MQKERRGLVGLSRYFACAVREETRKQKRVEQVLVDLYGDMDEEYSLSKSL